jgi:uncharacterized membrane protein
MKASNINRGFRLIGGLGLGAGLMYVFDPLVGKRRRAAVRHKMVHFAHKTADAIDVTSRDLKNSAVGIAAQTRRLVFRQKEVSDEVLSQRVRSRLGGLVSHPRSVEVKAEKGRIILSGPILANEADRLLKRVASVRGVISVENRLETHASAESIPGLQGQPGQRKGGETLDVMQANWSPRTRFIGGMLGGVLTLIGLKRSNGAGAAVATAGIGVLARSLTNLEFKRLIGVGAGRGAISIHKTVNVAAPVEEVFTFWSNYQNFPLFMSNVRGVKETGANRSHWVVAGPAGTPVEWNATITNHVPNKSLGWKTLPQSPIRHAGIVRFRPNADGTTRVEVKMSYNPVVGALGHAVASIFGADPKSEMDQDLMRMKSMIETGVAPHDAARRDAGEALMR